MRSVLSRLNDENAGGQRKNAGSNSEQTNQYSAMGGQNLTTEGTEGTEKIKDSYQRIAPAMPKLPILKRPSIQTGGDRKLSSRDQRRSL